MLCCDFADIVCSMSCQQCEFVNSKSLTHSLEAGTVPIAGSVMILLITMPAFRVHASATFCLYWQQTCVLWLLISHNWLVQHDG